MLTEDAVKKHLRRLYEKFHITGPGPQTSRERGHPPGRRSPTLGELRP